MKKHRERKPFKREYIPVIIAVIILIGLIAGLVFVILDKKEDFDVKIDEEIISVAVILPIDRKTIELKSIVTKEKYRSKGYAKRLLKIVYGNYKQKYDKILVGITENNIPFYIIFCCSN